MALIQLKNIETIHEMFIVGSRITSGPNPRSKCWIGDDFDFEIVNFPFLDGDVPRSTSYGVFISQLIRFARASSYVIEYNTRNKLLTQKLLKQGYRYHKLRKTF